MSEAEHVLWFYKHIPLNSIQFCAICVLYFVLYGFSKSIGARERAVQFLVLVFGCYQSAKKVSLESWSSRVR